MIESIKWYNHDSTTTHPDKYNHSNSCLNEESIQYFTFDISAQV